MAYWAEVKRYDNYGKVLRVADMGTHIPVLGHPYYAINITEYNPQPASPELGVQWYYLFLTDTFQNTDPGIVIPTPPKTVLTAPQLWMGRFTALERAKVWAVCNGETPPGVTINLENRYRIAAFRDVTLSGELIPLDASETVTVVSGMETAGIISAGRANEILQN